MKIYGISQTFFIEFSGEMLVRCGQYQIDLAEADINEDFKHVLYTYLLKLKRLF